VITNITAVVTASVPTGNKWWVPGF